jgi:hypothetical protein
MDFKSNFCKNENCRKFLKFLKTEEMQKTYFYYVYLLAQEFISKTIDKRYVAKPHEVNLFRIGGICEKFELIS